MRLRAELPVQTKGTLMGGTLASRVQVLDLAGREVDDVLGDVRDPVADPLDLVRPTRIRRARARRSPGSPASASTSSSKIAW